MSWLIFCLQSITMFPPLISFQPHTSSREQRDWPTHCLTRVREQDQRAPCHTPHLRPCQYSPHFHESEVRHMEWSTLLRLHVQFYWFIHKNAVFFVWVDTFNSCLMTSQFFRVGADHSSDFREKNTWKTSEKRRQNDWIVFLEWRTKRSVGCSDNDQPSARVIHTVHRVTITSINGDTSLLILSSSFLQLLSLNYSHSRHTPLLPHFIFC